MYSRARLDALSDGIFAVAMTLLVLDLRLPDDFHPRDAHELIEALAGLISKFVPYALSFLVLGLRWLSTVQVHSRAEHVERRFIAWWLLYLLLVTCVPFTTIVLGRYGNLAPAVWLYAGNTALIALVSFRMMAKMPHLEQSPELRERRVSLTLLIVTSLAAIAASFVSPRHSLWIFALNLLTPLAMRWNRKAIQGVREG
jgi:uncharacterized membrane protein